MPPIWPSLLLIASQRPYSIRTRIKTPRWAPHWARRGRQRPYSIRTRIKTDRRKDKNFRKKEVRDHIPLEQGLRQCHVCEFLGNLPVRDHIPLEQGLRPSLLTIVAPPVLCQRPYSIRTRIKTSEKHSQPISISVRDHIPLEQGLRQPWICP